MDGFLAAAEHAGVTAFQAKACNICGNVGASLVDNAHASERNAYAFDIETVGSAGDCASAAGVGKRDKVAECIYDTADALFVKAESVAHGFAEAVFSCGLDILIVFLDDIGCIFKKLVGKGRNELIFFFCACEGETGRCRLCLSAYIFNVGTDFHRVTSG